VKEFSAPAPPQTPALPADLASEPAQYEPFSIPSTTTADAGHVASGTTDAGAFLSFLEADIPKGEAHY